MQAVTIDIPQSRTWTDDDLFVFCTANRSLRIERDAKGFITIMSPSGGLSSHYISVINAELVIWNRKAKQGITFESSGRFILPDTSMRAPDIAWVSKGEWHQLSQKEKAQFPPLCPEFIIEVRSATDRLLTLKSKMQDWIKNGCKLAWLIDPTEKQVFIYHADGSVDEIEAFDVPLSGEEVLPGFRMTLSVLLEE